MTGLGTRVAVYESCGEAVAMADWLPGDRPEPPRPGGGGGWREDQGSEDRQAEGARRAATKLRRFAVHNRCTRLMTLTRADQTHDPGRMLADLAAFERRLRERWPTIAWCRALERHKSGAIHAHYAINQRLEHAEVAARWPHGFVWLSPKTRSRQGGREDARLTARYVAKYVLKDPVRAGVGGHRYEVRQGFQPSQRVVWLDCAPDEAMTRVLDSLGETPRYTWASGGDPEWTGPPVIFSSW